MMRFATISTVAILLAGCIPPEKPARTATGTRSLSGQEDEVVLEVNDEDLNLDQIKTRQQALQAALPTTKRERQLTVIADFEMLADEAEKRGYGKDPRVVDTVKDVLAREAKRLQLETEEPQVDADEAAVKAAIEAGRKRP